MEKNNFKRILVCRTDRIGDVLLSTPAIKALKKAFPQSYLAVMVRPYTRDIVLGNPCVDEVIICDKYGAERSFFGSVKFAWRLRKKKFDLAVILHPTNRVHIITFLAGIKKRVGFNRKMSFLLTDKLEHKKQEGLKSEVEYTLDMVRFLEVDAAETDLFMPVREESERYIEKFLRDNGTGPDERLVAFHPGASCPSKRWPVDRFALVADRVARTFGVKAVVVAGPDDAGTGKGLVNLMHCACIDASGKTTVSQLASLLKRCCLFISNDSGPVHIARALGVPVIAIFGRSQPGLSPRRWGPGGEGDIILHKDVGCSRCLAHNCRRDFACLKAVSVEDVLASVHL